MNLPNKLSLLRIALIPCMVAVFYIPYVPYRFTISAIIFAIAAFTDFLDGYIARKYNLVTDLGKFLDPIADKILVLSALVIMLTVPNTFGAKFGDVIGGVGVTIIVAREMTVSVLRMLAATKNKVLAAEKIGKIKTFATDFAIVFLLVALEFGFLFIPGLVLYLISVVLTVYSGVFYILKNKEVFI